MANPQYSAFEGTLVRLNDQSLFLRIGETIRTLNIQPDTVFWKAENTSTPKLFQLGDDVLVRIDQSGRLVKAWSNLTRVRGIITQRTTQGYLVKVGKGQNSPEKEIDLSRISGLTNASSQLFTTEVLPIGALVDVIGVKTGTTILVTKGMYDIPTSNISMSPSHNRTPIIKSDGANPEIEYCPITYKGHATWFDCGDGAGACGTCNTSLDYQLAWPEFSGSCGGCTEDCCECSSGCANQYGLSCDDTVGVTNPCDGVTITAQVADCGPDQISLCSYGCSGAPCGNDWAPPIVDLTKPTFAVFYDPADIGCFGCTAQISVPC